MNNTFIILVGLIVLALIALGLARYYGSDSSDSASQNATPTQQANNDATVDVTASGTLQ